MNMTSVSTRNVSRIATFWTAIFVVCAAAVIHGDDWPEFRGRGRLGVWNETGIVEKFPAAGLKVLWRTPVRAGYAGPAVADGRVFVLDYVETTRPRGTERAIALDEKTGKVLWTTEWPVNYRGISYPVGPRATPTVDGDRVYVAGADGKLLCLDVKTGAIRWRKDYVADYRTNPDTWGFDWGFSSAPLVDGDRLICLVGGQPDAQGGGVRQDDRQGDLAGAVFRNRARRGAANHRDRRRRRGSSSSGIQGRWRRSIRPPANSLLGTAVKVGAGMTVATPVQSGSTAVLHELLRRPVDARTRRQEAGGDGALEGQERQRDSNRRTPFDDLHAGHRRRLHLRHLQLRPVPVR